MSLEAMVWALRDAPVTDPAAKVVLIGLANHAHADGTVAFPRISVLAAYCRCSERTVQRKLADLLEAGVIRRGDQGYVGHLRPDRRPVVYDLCMAPSRGDNVSPREPSGVTTQAERGDTGVAHGVTTVSDITVLEPSLEPTTPHSPSVGTSPGSAPEAEGTRYFDLVEAFEEFWRAFPRKERKVVAEAAYRHALESTDPDTLLAGAKGYARKITRDGTEPRYIQTADRWLREERWTDDYASPRADRPWYHVAE